MQSNSVTMLQHSDSQRLVRQVNCAILSSVRSAGGSGAARFDIPTVNSFLAFFFAALQIAAVILFANGFFDDADGLRGK